MRPRSRIDVRWAVPGDTDQLLNLMRALADFESYRSEFRVDSEAILENGFGDVQKFRALVAEEDGSATLGGMAVLYELPWTFDLKPTLVLKELYVRQERRGDGIGKRLMDEIIRHGREIGASRLNWTVMSGNEPAERFYRQFGGAPDTKWTGWTLPLT